MQHREKKGMIAVMTADQHLTAWLLSAIGGPMAAPWLVTKLQASTQCKHSNKRGNCNNVLHLSANNRKQHNDCARLRTGW
jgi:hypothetical protein